MGEFLSSVLVKLQVPSYIVSGITILRAPSHEAGMSIAGGFLSEVVDRNSVLYLSGGKTPSALYSDFIKQGEIYPAASALVDERFGKPFNKESNELMLKEVGLLDYFSRKNIPFTNILKGKPRERTCDDYDQKLRGLFANYRKHLAILGVGMDGHTAGIPSDPGAWEEFDIARRSKTEMVIDFDDHGKFYNERISMSFLALSMMDVLLVLVFGKEKNRALEWMFADGSEEEVPSRFFKRPDIARKTILITDQDIH